ncbi:MAG: TonB-dependent receptor plug domain-containing protein, partial [Betaproteobacteria bacterium]
MNNKVLRGLIAGMCAGMSTAGFASDAGGTDKLGEVVVTATKTAKDTMDAPATVSVVTAKDIENRDIHSVDEAIALVPGVYATRSGGHEPSVMGTNVVMRGIPDYSRTLVLVDGQTLNDPYIGAVTWESVPAETVDRIEVVPGPFSSLYGGSAMGGVINIITKTPTKREVSVKGGYGTDNFKSGSLVYQDRLGERVGIVFDYAYKESDSYVKDEVVLRTSGTGGTAVTGAQRTTDTSGNTAYLVGDKGKNGWSSQNLGVKLYVDMPADSRLTLGASQFLYDSTGRNRYNSYLRDASGNPVIGNVTVAGTGINLAATEKNFLTGPDSEIKEVNRYSAEYETKLGKGGALKATLGYTDIPLYNNYFVLGSTATLNGGGAASRMLRPSNELSGSVQASLPLTDRHYLVTGMSANKRMIDTVTYSVSDWRNAGATGPIQNRTSGEDASYALYVQDEITLTDRLMAYLGGRYDFWSTEGFIEQVKAPASKNEFSSRSQTHFSPKASLVYRPVDTTTLRGSVGNSFHAPNLRDTFGWWTPTTGYTYTPNPDLKPETVTS